MSLRNLTLGCVPGSSALPMRSPILWIENLASSSPAQTSSNAPSEEVVLVPRKMHESYAEMMLPFASQPEFLEKYVNASGGIRTGEVFLPTTVAPVLSSKIGKLMEHLDSLASSIAYKHASVGVVEDVRGAGFYIVTAAVDRYVRCISTAFHENLNTTMIQRLDMLSPLTPMNVHDVRLSGQVISVGSSSMEVAVKMESVDSSGPDKTLLIGIFVVHPFKYVVSKWVYSLQVAFPWHVEMRVPIKRVRSTLSSWKTPKIGRYRRLEKVGGSSFEICTTHLTPGRDSPKTPHEVGSVECTLSHPPSGRGGSSCSRAFCETSYSGG